jgi:hypothetical protein
MAKSEIMIKNKLEILNGNVITVPGCEPVSSVTGTSLLRNINCNASVIPVEDVLRLIPGSKIVKVMTPAGQNGTGRFIELPSGPPPNANKCPKICLTDYYRILKENAKVKKPSDKLIVDGDVCSGFNFSGCVLEQDVLRTTRDPSMRPNSNPLG